MFDSRLDKFSSSFFELSCFFSKVGDLFCDLLYVLLIVKTCKVDQDIACGSFNSRTSGRDSSDSWTLSPRLREPIAKP